MPDTVNVPGVGPASKKWALAGGALVVGILGYAYVKRSQAPVEPTPPTPMELPPADLSTVSTGGGTTSTGLTFITTDAEWTADVLAKMGDLNFDTNAVSVALGKWFAGQQISAQEEQWIFAAIALAGMPPSGSHPIHLAPTPTSTSGTAPKPKVYTARTATWQGHRVSTRGVTLSSLASQFSHSKTPTGIYSTLKDIDARPENRTVYQRYGNLRPLPVGTIVLVPIWR